MKRIVWQSVVVAAAVAASSGAGSPLVAQRAATALPAVVVHKDATCGCCSLWGKHMEQAGFHVTYVNEPDMPAVRTRNRVPRTLQSCHTAIVGGYVVEGHVPAADVKRLVSARPAVLGVAVPGMPLGSPGMEQGNMKQSYAVMSFDAAGKTAIFAEH
jgi:hypothetical protein